MRELEQAIDELGERLNLGGPAGAEKIAEAEGVLVRPMPEALKVLYRRGDGGAIGSHVDIFDLTDFRDVNLKRAEHPADYLPSAVYFASDGSDGFFFIDTDGSLGEGKDAVLWADRARRTPADAIPCAPNLATFLRLAVAGEKPWLGASLRKIAIARMKATFATGTRQLVVAARAVDLVALYDL
jgi:hypothetical protein